MTGVASVVPVWQHLHDLYPCGGGFARHQWFVGGSPVLLGGFERAPWAAVVASSGLILGAWYMLWLYQRVFFRQVSETVRGLVGQKLDGREIAILLTMSLLIVGIGIFPNVLLEYMHVTVEHLVADIQQAFAVFAAN